MLKFPGWATTDIADIGNGDPNKEDPGPAKQAAGFPVEKPPLQHFNWLLNLIGIWITNIASWVSRAPNHVFVAGETGRVNNLSGSVTYFLPPDPLDGQWVRVELTGDPSDIASVVTIDGSGRDIMIAADTQCILDNYNSVFKFYWDETAALWKILLIGAVGVNS